MITSPRRRSTGDSCPLSLLITATAPRWVPKRQREHAVNVWLRLRRFESCPSDVINFSALRGDDANAKMDFFMTMIDVIIDDARSKDLHEVPLPLRTETFAKVIIESGIRSDAVCMVAALCLSRLAESPVASRKTTSASTQGM